MCAEENPLKVLWEADGEFGLIQCRVRLIKLEDSRYLEVLSPGEGSFWKRVKSAFSYIFHGAAIILTIFPLDLAEVEKLADVCKPDRENSQN